MIDKTWYTHKNDLVVTSKHVATSLSIKDITFPQARSDPNSIFQPFYHGLKKYPISSWHGYYLLALLTRFRTPPRP